jgi:hypothetical protein
MKLDKNKTALLNLKKNFQENWLIKGSAAHERRSPPGGCFDVTEVSTRR